MFKQRVRGQSKSLLAERQGGEGGSSLCLGSHDKMEDSLLLTSRQTDQKMGAELVAICQLLCTNHFLQVNLAWSQGCYYKYQCYHIVGTMPS